VGYSSFICAANRLDTHDTAGAMAAQRRFTLFTPENPDFDIGLYLSHFKPKSSERRLK
jgi:hypothetical protein